MQGYWFQLILVSIFVGFSVIQWVVRKVSQQRAIKAEREIQARMRDESLRTGRDPSNGEPTRGRRSQMSTPAAPMGAAQTQGPDPLAQRREQLRRLREQREAIRSEGRPGNVQASQSLPPPMPTAQVGGGGGGAGGLIRAELWPGGPTIVINSGSPAAQQVRAARPLEQRPPERPALAPGAVKSSQKRRPSAERVSRAGAEGSSDRPTRPRPVTPRPTSAVKSDERPALVRSVELPRTPAQWRAALILGEIMQKPVTERGPREF